MGDIRPFDVTVELPLSYYNFSIRVAQLFEFIDVNAFKVYYIPGNNPYNYNHRVRIVDESTLSVYLLLDLPRPPLLVYKKDNLDDTKESPEQDALDPNKLALETKSHSSGSSRNSQIEFQAIISEAVHGRDKYVCLACGEMLK